MKNRREQMNAPAVATKTFHELNARPEFMQIVQDILSKLKDIAKITKRARLVHREVDTFNQEVFSNPVVKELSPCKAGCSACCHTQVSVTDDEADLLVRKINEGLTIDQVLLDRQIRAENDPVLFYQLSFDDRKCVFLDKAGSCTVYEDRPSVCRTNAVIGSPDQCDTRAGILPTRLVRTEKADMAIYASFLYAKESGTLPYMISKRLFSKA